MRILFFTILFLARVIFAQVQPVIALEPGGHMDKTSGLKFTPDGKKLVSCSEDKTVRIWDIKSEKLESALRMEIGPQHMGKLTSLDISPNGRFAAVGGIPVTDEVNISGYITIIDLAKKEIVSLLTGTQYIVNDLAFTYDGRYLIAASDSIHIWNLKNLNQPDSVIPRQIYQSAVIPFGPPGIRALSFSPDLKILACAAYDTTIAYWKFEKPIPQLIDEKYDFDKQKPKVFSPHNDLITDIEFTRDGKYIITSGKDNRVLLFNKNFDFIKEIDNTGIMVFNVTSSPDSKKLIAAGYWGDNTYVYSLPDGVKLMQFSGNNGSVHSVDFCGNDTVATAGGQKQQILIWELRTGKILKEFKSKGAVVWSAAFGDGLNIAFGNINVAPLDFRNTINPPHYADYPYYVPFEKTFDFNNFLLSDFDLKEEKNYIRTQHSYGDLSFGEKKPYELEIVNGGKIINKDDWIRCFTFTKDGKIILGNEYSMQMRDSNGKLLREYLGHGLVWSVSPSKDGKYFVSGSYDNTIKLWDLEDAGQFPSVVDIFKHPSWKEYFKLQGWMDDASSHSRDGWRSIIQKFYDQDDISNALTLEKMLPKLGAKVLPLVTLFVGDDGEWICWTPRGFFNASPGGDKYFGWQVNRGIDSIASFYSAAQLFDKFYRPDIVREVIQTRQPDTVVAKKYGALNFDVAPFLEGVPEINLLGLFSPEYERAIKPDKNGFVELDEFRMNFVVTDQGGGIDQVYLYNGSKLAGSTERGIKKTKNFGDTIHVGFDVRLNPGVNNFKVTAFNLKRTESDPYSIKLNYDAFIDPDQDLYILAVGINEYKNSDYNLNYAQSDAAAFVDEIEKGADKIFGDVFPYLLLNKEATKINIEKTIKRIASGAEPEDVFIFFYAGHGVLLRDEFGGSSDFYLVLNDVLQIYGNEKSVKERGISGDDLLRLSQSIRAQKQLIVLDACHSGKAVDQFSSRGFAEEKAIIQLARSAGMFLLAATGSEQYATEFDSLGHGVFTFSIMEGLEGAADILRDQQISIMELGTFLRQRVPELSLKYKGKEQYPKIFSRGDDFPIVIIPK